MSAGTITLHIVWCTKYRRPLLTDGITKAVEQAITQKAAELNIQLLAVAIMPDHVHIAANIPTTLTVAQAVQALKGFTSYTIRKQYPHLKQYPALWARRYFACSVGKSATQAIKQYVNSQ